jgi:tRNA dimethylallyltransferase
LEEAQKNLENWDPALLSNRAIGAPELVAHLQGQMTLEDAREAATIATRQFAKRQRTWFRSKMKDWLHYRPAAATK